MISTGASIWDSVYAPLALHPCPLTTNPPFPISKVLRAPRFLNVFLYMMYDVA